MYILILKQFLRSRAVLFTLALVIGMGVISIFIGKQFLVKEENNIALVTEYQHAHIQRNVKYNPDNIGQLLYHLRFAFINKPDRLTALSIGQRDVNPGVQSVTIRNLEAQKYDADLNNPANLLSGNLDLGFIIIYLFPLVIIALTFNIQSEESESGTWRMVAIQSKSGPCYLLQKISSRALVIYSALLFLFLVAVLVLTLKFNETLYAFILLSCLYLAFWFSLSFWIVSFQKSSSYNALLLLAFWLVLSVVFPAAVNNYVSNRLPVPESMSTLIKQRDGYHKKWDADRKATMDKFYAHYPQFSRYGVPEGEFSYAWYYAMQQMGDDESLAESKAMRDKIMQREQVSRSFSQINPTMHTQLFFNELAGTGLQNHLVFLDQTNAFHEGLRLHFYPKIFDNSPVRAEDWESFQPSYAQATITVSWARLLLPLFIAFILISSLAAINIKRATKI